MVYDTYHFNTKEKVVLFAIWIGISGVVAYFFYRSWIVFGIVLLGFPLFLKWQRKSATRKRKWELTLAFREAVVIVAGNLQAGNSVENAFRRAYSDFCGGQKNRRQFKRNYCRYGRDYQRQN